MIGWVYGLGFSFLFGAGGIILLYGAYRREAPCRPIRDAMAHLANQPLKAVW
jgi:hypothetical protein